MKKRLLLFILTFMATGEIMIPEKIHAQSFTGFIHYLNTLPAEERMAAVDSFMTVITPAGFPYINDDTANFIYRGNAASIFVAGDFNGWEFNIDPLTNIEPTDFWYRQRTFELNARLDYKFVLDGSTWILDPLNPNTVSGGFGPNSELAMPEYIQPWEIETYAETSHGTLLADDIHSELLNKTYQLKVFLPFNYDENRPEGYPVAYFQDGFEYISLGSADKVFDNLIDSGLMCPVIGIFVKPTNRNEEYAGSLRESYRLFFVNELVPYIDSKYNTIVHPWGRAVIGDSFGGNISGLIAYNHPEVFGNCGLHSCAFWPNGYEAFNLITGGEKKEIRWASVWGTYESLWQNMSSFRDFLLGMDYPLHWLELPEGHSWGQWRATIDEIVPFFFPSSFMGTVESRTSPKGLEVRMSPNPFRERLKVEIRNAAGNDWSLSLVDISGKVVYDSHGTVLAESFKILIDGKELQDSVYLLTARSGQQSFTGKLVKAVR